MIRHKKVDVLVALFMAAAVLLSTLALWGGSALADKLQQETQSPEYESAVFDKTSLMSIDIVVDQQDWQNMLDNATDKKYIPATVVIDGKKLNYVGIRPKGNSSLSQVAGDDTTDRYSFKFEFDHYVDGQTLYGLDKMVVNNMTGDASWMKEYFSYDIMRFLDVPSPLYSFAKISVNGEEWGLYLAVEAIEESFAERNFGTDYGMLYKPESTGMGAGQMTDQSQDNMQPPDQSQGNMQPPDQSQGNMQPPDQSQGNMQPPDQSQGNMQPPDQSQGNDAGNSNPSGEQTQTAPSRNRGNGFGGGMGMSGNGVSLEYTDDALSSYSAIFENPVFNSSEADHQRTLEALKQISEGTDLEEVIDVDAMLRYMAAHTFSVNLDSYSSSMGHNYYLYEKDGQLSMIPWDYNLAFGGFQASSASDVVNFPIDTPVSGIELSSRPMFAKLLEVPQYLKQYHQYLQQLVDGYFNSGYFEQTVDQLNLLISDSVQSDPTKFFTFEQYQAAVPVFKQLGLLRAQSVEGQLSGAIATTTQGQSENPTTLIDASSINLQALGMQGGGAMGGNFAGGQQGFGAQEQGVDREVMMQAMQILSGADSQSITQQQREQIAALGVSEEQLTQLLEMSATFAQQGAGGFGNRPNERENSTRMGVPGSRQGQPGTSTAGWGIIAACLVLSLAALFGIRLFKRRRG